MSKINVARITWVVSLFLLLIVILLMVMDYKINYQYANMKKLYFYDCDGNICTSEVKDDNKNYISIYDCDDTCPVFKKVIFDNYILLVKDNLQILYNYTDGLVIGNQYDEYEFVGNDYIKVGKSNHYGIIEVDNKGINYYTKSLDVPAYSNNNGISDANMINFDEYSYNRFMNTNSKKAAGNFDDEELLRFLGELNLKYFTGDLTGLEIPEEYKDIDSYYLTRIMNESGADYNKLNISWNR